MNRINILRQGGTKIKSATWALLCVLCATVVRCRAQSAGPYVVMPGAQLGQDNGVLAQFQTSQVGNTNLFYGLFSVGSISYGGSAKENGYLCESAYANSNWVMVTQKPVNLVPDMQATNEYQGPTLHESAVAEIGGALYCAYVGKTAAYLSRSPIFIRFTYSADGINWRNIYNYYPPFGPTNTSGNVTNDNIPSLGWSTIPYGGTNWLIFDYGTNGQAFTAEIGRCFALGITIASSTNLTFSQPIQIATNLNVTPGGTCEILSNNAGEYILPDVTSTGSPNPWCSTNFFGPYTNLVTWTITGVNQDAGAVIVPLTNNTFWVCYSGTANLEWSTNWGTNWTSYGNTWFGFNPSLANPVGASMPNFGLFPSACIFTLTTPLNNNAAAVAAGNDALFSGTVSAADVTAQTISAPSIVADNIICGGAVAGTLHQPFYIRDSLNQGSVVTNNGVYCIAAGQNVTVGPDAFGSVFLGQGYYSDDAGASGGYSVFEFEDGQSPVNSPFGGSGNSGGAFYVNAGQIKFAQAAINSTVGYQANGTAGLTQNLNVQTNSVGPHGMTLEFKYGLYVGETPY